MVETERIADFVKQAGSLPSLGLPTSEKTHFSGMLQQFKVRAIADAGMSPLLICCFAFLLSSTCIQGLFAEDNLQAHFENQIRPVLVNKCLQCHGEKKQEGGLRLDSLEAMLKGGDSGPAIEAGSADTSLLIEALRYESYEMPPSGPLPDKVVREFQRWIEAGATWPETEHLLREEPSAIADSDRDWWAFRPVKNFSPPTLAPEYGDWCENEIDQFVLRRLNEEGLEPAPRADKETLIRRLYFDLIGLPPSPEEIEAFVANDDSTAWESTVDRLLEDPRYGEHWARYWLDVVRYSESDGWNQDAYRPHIWRYRDYVVQSLNGDKPYPQFVREQLAGDEIDEDNPEHLVATGFLRLGIYEYNQRDARSHWNDIMNEMTDVAGDVFFGMSMACARCHNHKFDPIRQQDYFQLRAFFEPVIWRDDLVAATQEQQAEYAEQMAVWEQESAEIQADIDALIEPYYAKKWESTVDKFPVEIQACFNMPESERTSWQQQMAYLVSRQFMEEGGGPLKNMSEEDKKRHESLKKQLAAFDDLKPEPLPAIMAATDFNGLHSPTFVPDAPERLAVAPGFLLVMNHLNLGPTLSRPPVFTSTSSIPGAGRAVLSSNQFVSLEPDIKPGTSGRRTQLAQWIGNPHNPLTTRVIVNRVWQQHFGRGLVETPNDFGTQGALPSHPELLDWLTSTFVGADQWSLKRLHKRILMSATWRQSADHPLAAEQQAKDPEEKFLWRWRVQRLQAEQIRDAMLVASGELKPQLGGPSVDEESPRRALYVKSFRNKYDTFLHGFDMANGLKSVPIRDTTTTPLQALLLVNGDYALGRAEAMAKRLADQHPDAEELLEDCFQSCWGRKPNDRELEQAYEFLGVEYAEEQSSIDIGLLTDFCHALLNSNAFLYVD